ncbi:hypothetical protein QVD17_27654 [Tagetes erecta]|uniref:DUF674 family protein n=1 Tax=Tagetes erecta TaxID=13708 RepID=A0AAD8K8X7_TARER|nr:hypothetical protein QVD17_27654 [Tagetes erecta]
MKGSRIMADTTAKEAKISMKVIVDKVKKRVVYAEADHTFVDILFSFLTLPMGTIVRLLGKHDDTELEVLGSLNNLYQSLKNFPECYLATEDSKFMLLNPRSLSYYHTKNLKLKIDDTEPMKYFGCRYHLCENVNKFMLCKNVPGKDFSFRRCGSCNLMMELTHVYWDSSYSFVSSGASVFVSDIETYIVTDDLCVEPYTSAISIRLLADFGITDMNHLEERSIEMSSYQMLHFLKTALSIVYPLTYLVFSIIKYPVRELLGDGQDFTVDQCSLLKKDVSACSKMRLEVSLQKSTGRLLFAEAKEDFVEFLFGFLSIPLGTIIGTLMNGASSFSCMDNVYKSISNVFPLKGVPARLSEQHKDPRIDGSLLKHNGMFMVTDDLKISPSNSSSTIDILKTLEVLPKDIERHEVSFGLKEGLIMLNASLDSCSTLTRSLEHQFKK